MAQSSRGSDMGTVTSGELKHHAIPWWRAQNVVLVSNLQDTVYRFQVRFSARRKEEEKYR